MSINIESPEGQKILSEIILLFKKNGNRMTTQQLHQQLPALRDAPLVEDGEDLITAILEAGSAAETADGQQSMMKIFTRVDENTYVLDAAPETLRALSGQTDAQKTGDKPAGQVSAADSSVRTPDSCCCANIHSSDDMKSLEKNLSEAREAIQDAAAQASSLKTQGQEMYEKTAQVTRRQLDSSYQDQLKDLQNRIQALQEALEQAGKEKNAVQTQADASLQSATELNEQLQEALEQKEQMISEYSSNARDNQQQVDALHQAIEEADGQLAEAACRAQASAKEIQELQSEAKSFDQYKTAMKDKLQETTDAYGKEVDSMQNQLDAARTDLDQTRERVSKAQEMADSYVGQIGGLTRKISTMHDALAQMGARLDTALKENEKLKKNLTDKTDESFHLAADYESAMKSYQGKIKTLLDKLNVFKSREAKLSDDLGRLHSENEKTQAADQEKISQYEEEIEALRSKMKTDYDKLVEAYSRIKEGGLQNEGLKAQLDQGQKLMKDLESRLNAALASLVTSQEEAKASQNEADGLKRDVQACQGQISSDQKTIEDCRQQIDGLKQALADAMNRKKEAQSQAAASEEDIRDLQTENEKWKAQIDDLQRQLDQAAAGLQQAREKAAHSDEKTKGLENSLQTLSSEKEGLTDSYQKGMASARTKIDSCLAQIDTLKKSLLNSEKEKEDALSQTQKVQHDYDSLNEQIDSWKDQMSQLQDQLDQARRKLTDAREETEAANARADQEAGKVIQLKASSEQQKADSDDRQNNLKNQVDTLQKQMEALRLALEEAQKAREQIRSQADDQQAQSALLKKTADDLESQLKSAGIELGKSKLFAKQESGRADQLQSEITALKDSNDQLTSALQNQKNASDQRIAALEEEVSALKKDLRAEKTAAADATDSAKKASLQNEQLKKNIDGLTVEKERIAALYSEDTGTLKEVIAKLEDRLTALNTALANAQDEAKDADSRAEDLQNCCNECAVTIRELENLSDRSGADTRKMLDGLQEELNGAYQELNTFNKARESVHQPECAVRTGSVKKTSQTEQTFVYEPDHGTYDDEIQISRDVIARQQEKIDEHEAQMEATDSSIMKAFRQAQINHDNRIIERENDRISDLEQERMSDED